MGCEIIANLLSLIIHMILMQTFKGAIHTTYLRNICKIEITFVMIA